MQSKGSNQSDSRAQWVVPPSRLKTSPQNSKNNNINSKKQDQRKQHPKELDSPDTRSVRSQSNCSSLSVDTSSRNDIVVNTINFCTPDGHNQAIILDSNLCRTLAVIIAENIKELRSHQLEINRARMRLVKASDAQEIPNDSGNFITHNDFLRLQVRDEQTKAIETIKQLNNYLGVTSALKRQIELTNNNNNSLSDDICNSISDLRADIIQALNDFVLTNSDVDIPIVDPEDPNCRDYDLCFDIPRDKRLYGSTDLEDSLSSAQLSEYRKEELRNNEPLVVISDENFEIENSNQVLLMSQGASRQTDIEKRRKEIHKLEKDTVELRKLFAEFYNLVKVQGETMDTIEDNIVVATQRIADGRTSLNKIKIATAIVPVTGCITGALIGGPIGFIVGGKLGTVSIICASTLLGLLSSLGAQKCFTGKRIKHE